MDGTEYRAILRGEKKGLGATAARLLFRSLAPGYRAAMAIHNGLFSSGLRPVRRLPIPVLSVGNLTLGGTGKTPMVAYLTEYFRSRSVPCGLLSRGYGGGPTPLPPNRFMPFNDEAAELAIRFGDLPHYQHKNRFAAGMALLRDHPETAVLILDDGFSHRGLARDLDLVLLDALEPFGLDRIFPAGTLREPLNALRRADIVLLSRADLVSPNERDAVRARVAEIAPQSLWGEILHRPIAQRRWDSSRNRSVAEPFLARPNKAKEKKIVAFCGLGNPDGFFRMLDQHGIRATEKIVFPDHHHYTPADTIRLGEVAAQTGADEILCTMKDWVKIRHEKIGRFPLFAIEIGIEFLAGESECLARFVKSLAQSLPALESKSLASKPN